MEVRTPEMADQLRRLTGNRAQRRARIAAYKVDTRKREAAAARRTVA